MEKAAWEKNGDCSIVCDYYQAYMSTAYTVNSTQCRCYPPQLAAFNEMNQLPLNNLNTNIVCAPDCKSVAENIMIKQPWRRPKF